MKKVLLICAVVLCVRSLYAQVPTVTSFSPSSGSVGTVVTITGINFSATAASNTVYFGATKATVTTAIATQLTVTVPSGATYQPITVTVSGLTAYSNTPFIVTFPSTALIDLTSFATKVDFGTGTGPQSIAVGDVDGDGKPDLVIPNYSSTTLSVFRNTSLSGLITVSSVAAKVDFTTGTNPEPVAFGDVDGDGKPDLVVANYGSNTVSVFRNTSVSGSITTGSLAAKVDFVTGTLPRGVAIGDVDGDGKPDIVVGNQTSNTVSVFRNTGTPGSVTPGSFAAKVDFTTGVDPIRVSLGDLDGDGKPDLVVGNYTSSTISVFRNTSVSGAITSGSFAAKVDFTTGTNPLGITTGDLDGDGKPDLVVTNNGSATVSVFRNTSTPGSITTGSLTTKIDFATTGSNPYNVSIGDMDGDGKPDLVVANSTSNTVSVFKNTSVSGAITTGSFAPKVDFTTGVQPFNVAIGDMDGDGKPDLVVANNSSNTVSVFRNTVAAPGPAPTIANFNPTSGAVGTSVTITGTNFDATPANNTVKFNATAAIVTASTATSITTSVPAGAITGTITVTVGSLTATSTTNFTVSAPLAPTITSFNPTIGTIGTSVVITGTSFDTTPTNNTVKFNGTTATVIASTTTSITTTVPTGATAGPITVTVGGQTATSATNFKIDVTPPQVTSNLTPVTIAPNTDLLVSANFMDDLSGIAAPIKIQYRPIAGTLPNNFISQDMIPTSPTSATFTISAGSVTELGVEYKFLLTDGVGNNNSANQTLYKTVIKHSALNFTSYPPNAAGTYRIIAIPLVLDNKTANDVFNNVIGGYNPTSWRMFKYNGSGFSELNGSSVLIPGEGYWFIAASSSPLDTGPGTTVDVNTGTPFTVTLDPGWNQIGNPYNFNISWSDVIAANPSQAANLGGNTSKIRVFRGGVDNVDALKSLEGGFVKYLGTTAAPIKIPVAKNASIQGRVASESTVNTSLDQASWEVFFNLRCGEVGYKLGGLGMHPEAKEGFDFHDDFNSPRFLEYLEVKFPKKYLGMSYTKDVVPTAENYVWKFSVESNLEEENTSLNWDNSYFGNVKEIYLLDVKLHKVTDMRVQSHYEFSRLNSKDFKVVFGSGEFGKQELMPSNIVLYDPFPNPFVEEVSIGYALPKEVSEGPAEIEVYNSTGARIAQMQTSEPGVGNWVWKSDQQAPGLYFIRLRAGNGSITRKVLKR